MFDIGLVAGSVLSAMDMYGSFLGGIVSHHPQHGPGTRNYHKGVDRSGAFIDDGPPNSRQRIRAKARATAKFVDREQRRHARAGAAKKRRSDKLRRRAAVSSAVTRRAA